MLASRLKLLAYAVALSAAYVELMGSLAAGVWHSPLYWATVAGIIPAGLLGIRDVFRSKPLVSHREAAARNDRTDAFPGSGTGGGTGPLRPAAQPCSGYRARIRSLAREYS